MFTTFRPGRDGNIAVTLLPQFKTQTNLSWGISGDARCAICDVGRADRRSRCSCCRDLHAVSRAAIAVVTVTAGASYRIHRARISATARNATANKSARMSGIRTPSRVCGKIVLKARDLRRLAAAPSKAGGLLYAARAFDVPITRPSKASAKARSGGSPMAFLLLLRAAWTPHLR